MGLLDDAIREHLELKRRRGADPNEVERLEREALGPVRRGPQVSDEPLLDEEPLDNGTFDHNGAFDHEEPFEHEERRTLLYDDEAAEAPESLPGDEPGRGWSHDPAEPWEQEEPLAGEDPAGDHAASRGHEPGSGEPGEGHRDHPGQETVEYDVEGEEKKKGEDDVLEETPEFLQDTPDHDRLWFEQKPPRDFDFDK